MVFKDKQTRDNWYKNYQLTHKAQIQKYQQGYYLKHRTKKLARAKRRHYEDNYGITLEEYEILYETSNGLCAICGEYQELGKLCVDHDHSTGKVRGLLCNNCNSGIGYLKDSPEILIIASEYLKKHK